MSELTQAGEALAGRIRALFGRSLQLRAVDTGSCNGCEIELTQLSTPYYDVQRFGIDFVASPRHADAILVTGPVTRQLAPALLATYEAMPEPKLVIAVGACAISGGIFADGYATLGGVDKLLPVDAYIPGCPPRPLALIHGLLLAIGRAEQRLATIQ
ncbi:MAG TPA: NADH-quinone oxidoreductase subunit B family protein [Oscillatoriaceae cyanobacterium]